MRVGPAGWSKQERQCPKGHWYPPRVRECPTCGAVTWEWKDRLYLPADLLITEDAIQNIYDTAGIPR